MKKLILITLFISIVVSLKSQHNWSFAVEDFTYSQTISGQAYIEGNLVNGQQIQLGAFCEDECRGIVKTSGGGCTYSTFQLDIYGREEQGEIIHFVLRDTDLTEYEILNTVIFEDGNQIGDLENPFLWMDEFLYASTDFLYFALIIGEEGIIDNDLKVITVFVSQNQQSLYEFAPYFVTAPGAKVFVADEQQFSELSIINLSQPNIYSIIGVDGLVEEWTVNAEILSSIDADLSENYVFPTISYDGWVYLKTDKKSDLEVLDVFGRLITKANSIEGNSAFFIKDKGAYFIRLTFSDGKTKVLKVQRQ